MNEGNVLMNAALNIFYLRLYDVIYMVVKDHTVSERWAILGYFVTKAYYELNRKQ